MSLTISIHSMLCGNARRIQVIIEWLQVQRGEQQHIDRLIHSYYEESRVFQVMQKISNGLVIMSLLLKNVLITRSSRCS